MVSRSVSELERDDEFFVVEDPFADRAIRVDFPEELTSEEIDAIFTGRRSVVEPIRLDQYMGLDLTDVVWTGAIKPLIVRAEVIDLLEIEKITGWSTYPIHLPDVPEGGPYRGLSITGRAGPIDDSKSEIKMKQYPARLAPVRQGLYFDPSTWDGSDLFVTEDASMWLFGSRRVKTVFEEAGIENIDFLPASEFQRRLEEDDTLEP